MTFTAKIDIFSPYPSIPKYLVNLKIYYFILKKNIDRDKLSNYLHENGIENANAYYPACHQHDIYKDYVLDDYPIANDILKRHLSLPMYYELEEDGINEITDFVKKGVEKLK